VLTEQLGLTLAGGGAVLAVLALLTYRVQHGIDSARSRANTAVAKPLSIIGLGVVVVGLILIAVGAAVR
jgi:uncharacterized membrane protein YidH (DUF202 family)